MADAPLEEIGSFVSGMEEQEKAAERRETETYFYRESTSLGALAGQVLNSPAFFEAKWLNKTTSAKTWQAAVDEKINRTAWDLNGIQTAAGPHAGAVTAKYLETLSTVGPAADQDQLAAVSGPGGRPFPRIPGREA